MCNRRQAGLTLIEVVLFIIVLGIGFVGIMILYNQVTTASVDPMVRKQALAIATSMMDEITLKPSTYCDPDDSQVYTASAPVVGATGCSAGLVEVVPNPAPNEQVEVRSGTPPTLLFDNVNDYNGFSMSGGAMATASGNVISGLGDYSVAVAIAESTLSGVPATESLLITVTATHVPTSTTVTLQGYRLRYAPNSP